jgi:tetratricopeptide (TPR) repeat protein
LEKSGSPHRWSRRIDLLSLLTAALFISHPIQVNTVTYIVERNEGLASLFYLLSLFLFMKGSFSKGLPKLSYFLGVALTFLFAVFSKETGLTLPIVLILFDLLFVCRNREMIKKRLFVYLGVGVLLISYLLFFMRGGIFTLLFRTTHPWTPWENLLTQSNVIIQYFKLLLLPLPQWLNVDHDFQVSRSFFEYPTFISLSILFLLLILAAILINKNRLVSFSIFCFFIILAPTSSIIPIWDIMVEYRLYLPLFFYALLLTVGVHYLDGFVAQRFSERLRQVIALGIPILILGFYFFTTIERNRIFRDGTTLWTDAAKKSPNKMRVHHNLGKAYLGKGRIEEGIREAEIALKLSGNLDIKENVKYVLNLLGGAYFLKGESDKALRILQKAIEVDPNYATSYYNVSCIYAAKEEKERAFEYLKKAIALDPKYKEKAKDDKDFDSVRGEKEFEEMIK